AHNQCTAKEADTRAIELLGRVGIPDPDLRAGQYPHQFSGGQRQRVMIAMALALEPDLLIADEPTTALDVTVQAQILNLLKRLQVEEDMGLVLITHDLGVAADMADRVAVMHQGKIVEQGPVGQIFSKPQHSYTRRLMTSIPGQVADRDEPAGTVAGEALLLEVKDLAKHYEVTSGLLRRRGGQKVRAVDGVSFNLAGGETLGIVGESGSGKSTLGRAILRLEDPTRGTVLYRGRDIFTLNGADLLAFRRQVQVVFQDPYSSLNPRMNVAAIISEPWAIHRDVLEKRFWADGVADLLAKVGLDADHARRYPHQFSGGQRQRIAIARALALQPELIICDEAVSALDVSIQAQVIALLARLRDEMGLAYIFIAHDLHVVEHFADRVLVMQAGRIVEQGEAKQIFEAPEHPYTRDLLAASPVPDPAVQAARRRQVLAGEAAGH
ncbi:MAG: dipeptide ABC transporter ATP-binding protein, partial [Alphaproteobacteria bacterium]